MNASGDVTRNVSTRPKMRDAITVPQTLRRSSMNVNVQTFKDKREYSLY